MPNTPATRRDLLKFAATSALTLAAGPALAFASEASQFPKPATPDAAFDLLKQGNARYFTGKLRSCTADLAALRHAAEPHQEPFAAILSCADSRVPAELLFDQPLGHLFIVRVAGNIAAPDTIASLEYAAAVLNVKAILVLGHTQCGGPQSRGRPQRSSRPDQHPLPVHPTSRHRRRRPYHHDPQER